MLDSSLPLPHPCRATGAVTRARLLGLVLLSCAHAVILTLLATGSGKDRYVESGQQRLERLPLASGRMDGYVDNAARALEVDHRLPAMWAAKVEMGV